MKSFAVLSFLASLLPLALAADSNIPSGISSTCYAYYVQLNANTSVTACLNPLISATSQFTNPSSPPSSSTINAALNTICSSSTTCSSALINSQLALFYAACQTELTSSSFASVVATYDLVYTIPLLQQSLCQKDDSGKYCVVNMTSPSSSSTTKRSSSLDRRDDSQAPLVQELKTYGAEDIAFLTLQPNLTAKQLCTQCTRSVMNVYTTALNSVPYGPGLGQSLLLSGQQALYSAINTKCGPSFLSGAIQAAGALSTGAAPRAADSTFALLG